MHGKSAQNTSATTSTNEVEEDGFVYLPLYKAAVRNDWEKAMEFFRAKPDLVPVKARLQTPSVLHMAVGSGRSNTFVEKLLEKMTVEEVKGLRNKDGSTVLHFAAFAGNLEAAKLLLNKCGPDLAFITDYAGVLPIVQAAIFGQKDIIWYLWYSMKLDENLPDSLRGEFGAAFICFLILVEFFDVALRLVKRYPEMAATELKTRGRGSALSWLCLVSSSFPSGCQLPWWQRIIYQYVPVNPLCGIGVTDLNNNCIDKPLQRPRIGWRMLQKVLYQLTKVPTVIRIKNIKSKHHEVMELMRFLCKRIVTLGESTAEKAKCRNILLVSIVAAARFGVLEMIEEILHSYPEAVDVSNEDAQNLFHIAIVYRREAIFSIINQIDYKFVLVSTSDKNNNNLLHLAGKLAPIDRLNVNCGAALQMQRELQWFKEVETLVPHNIRKLSNKDDKSPHEVFSEEHKELVKKGERWLKDTASSCTIVAALISTMVFAAAITVPGGNNQNNGLPMFSNHLAFRVFLVCDMAALFSSIASVLMFLSILTSRFAEEDFLHILPQRLIISLITLFIAITSMMIAFSSTIYLILSDRKIWIIIIVGAFASFPIALFASLQFPLLLDMIYSTYGPTIFSKKSKLLAY